MKENKNIHSVYVGHNIYCTVLMGTWNQPSFLYNMMILKHGVQQDMGFFYICLHK